MINTNAHAAYILLGRKFLCFSTKFIVLPIGNASKVFCSQFCESTWQILNWYSICQPQRIQLKCIPKIVGPTYLRLINIVPKKNPSFYYANGNKECNYSLWKKWYFFFLGESVVFLKQNCGGLYLRPSLMGRSEKK